jgi:hypothetical protein
MTAAAAAAVFTAAAAAAAATDSLHALTLHIFTGASPERVQTI